MRPLSKYDFSIGGQGPALDRCQLGLDDRADSELFRGMSGIGVGAPVSGSAPLGIFGNAITCADVGLVGHAA